MQGLMRRSVYEAERNRGMGWHIPRRRLRYPLHRIGMSRALDRQAHTAEDCDYELRFRALREVDAATVEDAVSLWRRMWMHTVEVGDTLPERYLCADLPVRRRLEAYVIKEPLSETTSRMDRLEFELYPFGFAYIGFDPPIVSVWHVWVREV